MEVGAFAAIRSAVQVISFIPSILPCPFPVDGPPGVRPLEAGVEAPEEFVLGVPEEVGAGDVGADVERLGELFEGGASHDQSFPADWEEPTISCRASSLFQYRSQPGHWLLGLMSRVKWLWFETVVSVVMPLPVRGWCGGSGSG
jgi:hypothetical protein